MAALLDELLIIALRKAGSADNLSSLFIYPTTGDLGSMLFS